MFALSASDSTWLPVPPRVDPLPMPGARHNHGGEPRTRVSAAAERLASPGGEYRDLLARVAAGDAAALGTLYDRTNRLVYGLALRILGETADAEEVTLDVYTQVWKQADRFDPARGEAVTWLLTLTHSRAIDRLRSRSGSRRREQELDEGAAFAAEGPDPEAATELGQRARSVRCALALLSPEQRQVIELAYFEGLTHVEIAERIGQPLGTTKSRIRLGMAKLRDTLAEHAPEVRQ